MAQEAVLDTMDETPAKNLNEALVVCKSCKQLVPKTMVCLYCGSPILFKNPRKILS